MQRIMIGLTAALLAGALTGCSGLLPSGVTSSAGGGATYTLKRTENGCEVVANSSREVGPAAVHVDGATCSLFADVDSLEAIPVTPELLRMLLGR